MCSLELSLTCKLNMDFIAYLLFFLCPLLIENPEISGTKSERIATIFKTNVPQNEDPAVTLFREYLRINSAQPNPDYEGCIKWLQSQADQIGLEYNFVSFNQPNAFALWLTWRGTDPNLKSILLNSHMDVVDANPDEWSYPPFDAYKNEHGNIYARGAKDMKSATVAQLEAIRRLKAGKFQPLRSIHISILPDEEAGGRLGMQPFVNSSEFAALNVGFDMDETGPSHSVSDQILVAYGEKSAWHFNFTITGVTGHSSLMDNNTAAEKLQIVINRLMAFRAKQVALLSQPNMTLSDVTSVNLVQIGGGKSNNVIPSELWVAFDMRIRIKPGWNFTDIERMLNDIVEEAGPGVSLKFIQKTLISTETPVDNSNIWWVQIQRTCQELKLDCVPHFQSGASDGKFVRNVGIPVLGINPFLCTERRAHVPNEFINEKEFLAGINRYTVFIRNLASVSAEDHD